MIALCLVAVAACGRTESPGDPPRLRIAAASDLNAALPELIARFKAGHGVDVSVSYGSSGMFYAQLLNGAPFDMFLSADLAYPKQLADRGLTVPGSEFSYATGRLVVWVRAASTLDIQNRGAAVLTASDVSHVAIANPEHAPYGRAAVAALQREGLYDAVKGRLVFGESVAQAMQFAQSGAADAALVALSLALAPGSQAPGRWIEVPSGDYPAIQQGGVILQWASNVDAARAFRVFVIGRDGQALLRRYGFGPPSM